MSPEDAQTYYVKNDGGFAENVMRYLPDRDYKTTTYYQITLLV